MHDGSFFARREEVRVSSRASGNACDVVDLRSDTVTRPSEEMRHAMFVAEVGDDVYGEDPTVQALEQEVAALLGKQAAMFTPSGTMANQIAIMLHTRPGESIICEESSHVVVHESGGAAALAGAQFELMHTDERLSDAAIDARFRPEELHAAPTVLLIVENTHNRAAGRVLRASEIARITVKARALGLRLHCDGARLWNAAVAAGETERELVAGFDTVSVCFSKGLGAPVGSALAGGEQAIRRGRTLRKRLGGGMRQAGVLAAAALCGVRGRARLAEDHRRAAAFARGLRVLRPGGCEIEVDIADPPTNMVYWRVPGSNANAGNALATSLAERGTRMLHVGSGWLRAVTHLDVTDAGIERALEDVRTACSI